MNKITILLYTHTDYKDVCIPFFGQMEKYMLEYKKIIMTDCEFDEIPKDYQILKYNTNHNYKTRILSCLAQLENQPVLFIHEDMFLFDHPKKDIISELTDLVIKKEADFIKLIKAGNFQENSTPHINLVTPPSDNLFSIQPTICMKNNLEDFFTCCVNDNIYDIEREASNACHRAGLTKCFMTSSDGEEKRGSAHWDSKIFPYIATAVVKGKWNCSEYPNELSAILKEYSIDKYKRGIF